jgi:hypothetical protein
VCECESFLESERDRRQLNVGLNPICYLREKFFFSKESWIGSIGMNDDDEDLLKASSSFWGWISKFGGGLRLKSILSSFSKKERMRVCPVDFN